MTAPPLFFPASTIQPTEHDGGQCSGITPYALDVDHDGSASIDVPLWVPPGRAGMQPALSLRYRSHHAVGTLGVGWALSGLPSIVRVPKTVRHDGAVGAIRFDDTDRFALGGQRLVRVGGRRGQVGAEYRTQIDEFSRITVTAVDALGPQVFELRERGGRILTFGADPIPTPRVRVAVWGARQDDVDIIRTDVRYSWSLRQIADRAGNTVDVAYAMHATPDGAEWVPIEISYTGSLRATGLPPMRRVRFVYGAHARPTRGYIAGLPFVRTARLDRIEMWAPHPSTIERVRVYRLSYFTGTVTGRSLLVGIEELDGRATRVRKGSTPMPFGVRKGALTFGWMHGSTQFAETDTGIDDVRATPGGRSSLPGRLMIADLDGDGRDDIVYAPFTRPNQYAARLAVPGASTFGAEQPTGLPQPVGSGRPMATDPRMAGRLALLTYDDALGGPQPIGYRLTRADPGAAAGQLTFTQDQVFKVEIAEVADLVGDRLPDLITSDVDPQQPALRTWQFRRNNGAGFDPPTSMPVLPDDHRFLDVDGDGAMELLSVPAQGLGPRYYAHSTTRTAVPVNLFADRRYIFADINGDGLVDAISHGVSFADSDVVCVWINTGAGFLPPVCQRLANVDLRFAATRVIDIDSDGEQELIARPRTAAQNDPFVALKWNGTMLVETVLPLRSKWIQPDELELFEILDIDGNGLDDIVMSNRGPVIPPPRPRRQPTPIPGSTMQPGPLRVLTRQGGMPDLLAWITDARGRTQTIEHRPIIDSTVYSAPTPTAYPMYGPTGRRWVVSAVSTDMGHASPNRVTYRYEDARVDLLGGGSLGFRAVIIDDAARQSSIRHEFDPERDEDGILPLAGLPVRTITTTIVDATRTRTTTLDIDYTITATAGGRCVSVQTGKMVEQVDEAVGTTTTPVSTVTTTYAYDSWDNCRQTTTVWSDGSRLIETNTFDVRPAEWLISLPRTSAITDRPASGGAQTRRRAFEHDAQGLLTREIREPGPVVGGAYTALGPQSDGVETLFTSFRRSLDGVVTAVELSGDPAPFTAGRTMELRLDAVEAMFAIEVRNPLGHVSRVSYLPSVGLPALIEDVNGRRTAHRYDGFGRLRRLETPDRKWMEASYRLQSSAPVNTISLSPTERVTTTLASGASSTAYLDRCGRPVLDARRSRADGQEVYQAIEYDQLGRRRRQSRHFLATESPAWSVASYDGLDRLTALHWATGLQARVAYDGLHRVVTDALGRTSASTADVRGRVIELTEASPLGSSTTRHFTYGPFGLPRSADEAFGKPRTMSWDRCGRLIGDRPGSGGPASVYRYTPFDEIRHVDAGGAVVDYMYDGLGRLQTITRPEGVDSYTWDPPNAIGALARTTSADGVETHYQVDGRGRIRSKAWIVDNTRFMFTYRYDAVGRLSRIGYPRVGGAPFEVELVYSPSGGVAQIRDAIGGATFWTNQQEDASGTFGIQAFGNGVSVQTVPDAAHPGLLRRAVYTDASATIIEGHELTFDATLAVRDRIGLGAPSKEAFAHDDRGRLHRWTRRLPAGDHIVEWSYDAAGNVTQRRVLAGVDTDLTLAFNPDGSGPTSVTSPAAPSGAVGYDARGNQTGAPGRTIGYATIGLPRTVTTGAGSEQHAYDVEGSRVLSVGPTGQKHVRIAGLFEATTQPRERRYRLPIGRHVVVERRDVGAGSGASSEVRYLLTDHVGSIAATTDAAGVPVERFRYDPYGRRVDPVSPAVLGAAASAPGLGFVGGTHDRASALIDLDGRWYDPAMARFMSRDPLQALPRGSRLTNDYAYALGDPATMADPSGEAPEDQVEQDDTWIADVNHYLHEHRNDAWATLDAAVDYANSRRDQGTAAGTAASAIGNDWGFGGGGIIDVRPRQPPPKPPFGGRPLYADNFLDQLKRRPGASVLDTGTMEERAQFIRLQQELMAREGIYRPTAPTIASTAIDRAAQGVRGTPTLVWTSALVWAAIPVATLGGLALSRALTIRIVPLTMGTGAGAPFGIQVYRTWGDRWADTIAEGLAEVLPAGYRVIREFNFFDGLRRLDIVVFDELGELVFAIEAKAGPFARYLAQQRALDQLITKIHGIPVFVYRIPWSVPWWIARR